MRFPTIFILYTVLLAAPTVLAEVWDFGVDVASSTPIGYYKGCISLLERQRRVKIVLPPCYDLKYVRVEVESLLSTPSVTFNNETTTVSISYKPWQFSSSIYDIVATGVQYPNCINGTFIV